MKTTCAHIEDHDHGTVGQWIGLNDRSTEGSFVWDGDNQPLLPTSYQNFSPGEPSDSGDNENCVAVR